MARLPAATPREAAAALMKAGFEFARQRGSHRIYVKGNVGVTIPWHNRDLRKGTLRQILRQAGLSLDDFTRLLSQ